MPDFDYTGMVDTADRLVARFGRDLTLVSSDPGVLSDPAQPWEPYADGAQMTVRGVVVGFAKSLIKSGAVQRGDKRIVLASKSMPGLEVQTDWRVLDGGVTYTIIDVEDKRPGPDSIVQIVQVRA